tara:strand:- start:234 stop:539 length:306 start_codon:yes stop_codon:yes gene_type:complete
MVITINEHDFIQAFKDAGRQDQFSLDALRVIFNYEEERESQMTEPTVLDVIALCCDFAEYDSIEDFQEEYGEQYVSLEDIEEQTVVLTDAPDYSGFVIEKF